MFEQHIHPALSNVPLVLLSIAGLREIQRSQGSQGSSLSWVIWATVFVLFAFLSGYLAAPYAHSILKISEPEISFHHRIGKVSLICSVVTMILGFIAERARYNQNIFRTAYRLFLLCSIASMIYGGYLGGALLLTPRM
jgi:uncharacterized membrane protein